MHYLLLAFLLLPLWGLAYALLARFRHESDGEAKGRVERYLDWIHDNLNEMFYQVPRRRVGTALLVVLLLAGVGGFLLPAGLPSVNRMALENAMDLNRRGEHEAAHQQLQDALREPSPLAYNELGVSLLGLGDYEAAADAFRNALALEPTYGKAHANLAMAYRFLDNQERMQFQLTRAREMAKYPLNADAIWGRQRDVTQGLVLRLCSALLFVFLAWKLPRLVVATLRNRRMARYDAQLPDALIMAANGLRAGFSLVQALEMVSRETTPPLSQEFQLVLKEHQLGAELNEALEHLARRIPSMDTRIFVNSMIILREVGGNLTEIFDTLAETIKERKRVQQKIKTMTAEGTTQAYILALLPVVLGFIMYKLNPEVTGLLFTTSLGWLLILLMALMEGLGLAWMLKTVKVRI